MKDTWTIQEGFDVERIVVPDIDDATEYRFTTNYHLGVVVTNADTNISTRDQALEYGLREFATELKKRCEEILKDRRLF